MTTTPTDLDQLTDLIEQTFETYVIDLHDLNNLDSRELAENIANRVHSVYRDQVLTEAGEIASTVIGPLWHLDTLHELNARLRAARATTPQEG